MSTQIRSSVFLGALLGFVALLAAGCHADPSMEIEDHVPTVTQGGSLSIATTVSGYSSDSKLDCQASVGDCQVGADKWSVNYSAPSDAQPGPVTISVRLLEGDRVVQTKKTSLQIEKKLTEAAALPAAGQAAPGSVVAPPAHQKSNPVAERASIVIDHIPPANNQGSDTELVSISGTVSGVTNPSDYKVVLYSQTNVFYVQPTLDAPYTMVDSQGHWSAEIHPGGAYCAMLVASTYVPKGTRGTPPTKDGNEVLAVKIEAGKEK
jgi:hypothetical protein